MIYIYDDIEMPVGLGGSGLSTLITRVGILKKHANLEQS